MASSLAKNWAWGSSPETISLLDGNVCIGRRTYLLRPVKSTTSRNSPLLLVTKKPGAHQSEGSDIVAMTLLSISC